MERSYKAKASVTLGHVGTRKDTATCIKPVSKHRGVSIPCGRMPCDVRLVEVGGTL